MLRPPIWISSRMTIFPKKLQYEAVSTTTRPVTQTLVAAVKSAVSKGHHSPDAVENGSISSMVPSMMTARNVSMMILTVE